MAAVEPAKRIMARHLREAIDDLRGDIERLEFWAQAMDGLAQPIPGYDAQSICGLTPFSLTAPGDTADAPEAPSGEKAGGTNPSGQDPASGD